MDTEDTGQVTGHVTQCRAQVLPGATPTLALLQFSEGLPAHCRLLSPLAHLELQRQGSGSNPHGLATSAAALQAAQRALHSRGSKAGFTFQSGAATFSPSQQDPMPTANS